MNRIDKVLFKVYLQTKKYPAICAFYKNKRKLNIYKWLSEEQIIQLKNASSISNWSDLNEIIEKLNTNEQ